MIGISNFLVQMKTQMFCQLLNHILLAARMKGNDDGCIASKNVEAEIK